MPLRFIFDSEALWNLCFLSGVTGLHCLGYTKSARACVLVREVTLPIAPQFINPSKSYDEGSGHLPYHESAVALTFGWVAVGQNIQAIC